MGSEQQGRNKGVKDGAEVAITGCFDGGDVYGFI